ncbi:MAG TPA: hypothetical protein VGM10_30395 [Actinocrinis sp.]
MTLDPTAAVPAADETWIRQLTQGFGALLGRALSEYDPDAVYAAYFGGNFISEIEYAHDDAWVDPEALAGRRAVEDTPLSMYDMGEPPLVFDASESIFELRPSELPDALAADVPGVTFSEPDSPYPLVRGRDLGELLARHGVDLTDPDLAEGWTVCHARIASDGSLLSALCAATGIGLAERYLVAFADEPAEEWEQALEAVENLELRAHLALGCRESYESEGLSFSRGGPDVMPLLRDEGCATIAAWEECQGQVEIAVVRLADAVAGRGARKSDEDVSAH